MIKELMKLPGVAAAVAQLVPVLVGTGMLIAIWSYLVEPILERNRIDWTQHKEIVDKSKEICTSLERTQTTQKEVVVIQDKIAERLERMMNK